MANPQNESFDLDEDLFGFDEILDGGLGDSEAVDLDELLMALEETESASDEPAFEPSFEPEATFLDDDEPELPAPEPAAEEPSDDLLIGEEPAPEPMPAAGRKAERDAEAATQRRAPESIEIAAEDPQDGREILTAAEPRASRRSRKGKTGPVSSGSALSGRVARFGFLLLAVLALLNIVQVALSWERNRDLSQAMSDLEGRFLTAAGDLEQSLFQQTEAMERNRLPVVAPTSAGRETLDHVIRQLDSGMFDEARRRLYALLAVTGRYDEDGAREVEAAATYLLADSWRLQAERKREELAQ